MEKKLIIFMGKSGSGKGTQLALYKSYLENIDDKGVFRLETGKRFRAFIEESGVTNELSKRLYMHGDLQPNFLAVWLWSNILMYEYNHIEHLLIDGCPRSVYEAHMLLEAFNFYQFKDITFVYLKVSDGWATERLLSRDRIDDNVDNIKERLSWFHDDVEPIFDILKTKENIKIIEIDGEKSIEEVNKEIIEKC